LKTKPFPKSFLQNSFRRTYADAAPPSPPPSPKPRRRFRFLRWTFRLTLLALVGGAGLVTYNIYTLRNPVEQFDPDPGKKTLVILGMCTPLGSQTRSITCVKEVNRHNLIQEPDGDLCPSLRN
jgi:hypothetical protein